MHTSPCRRDFGPLEAPGTSPSSSPPTPRPCPRPRRPRRVLYPAQQCKRPPVREAPDQACRWLLLLSAFVLLQILTEEVHVCTGQLKNSKKTTLLTHFWSVTEFQPFFYWSERTLMSFDSSCWLADLQNQCPSIVTPLSQDGDVSLDTAQGRNPGGFRPGLDQQRPSGSVWCPDGEAEGREQMKGNPCESIFINISTNAF